ncbi:MAG: hypothetical protein ABIS23_02890 [Sphingomicrobium sp.]
MSKRILIACAIAGIALFGAPGSANQVGAAHAPAPAQQTPPAASVAADVYAPFDWLVGDWTAQAGPGVLREHLTYGPNRSYIRFSVFASSVNGPEHLHFEGIAMWNGKTRMLDYLFVVEPGSGAQENGTIRADADGTIVREVELITPSGKVGTFRQTFRSAGPDRMVTTVMRKTDKGWEPTFPGGERIEMTRRPG